MAYDDATAEVVLFGGAAGNTLFSDTWGWNGVTWVKKNPALSPIKRFGAAMAYDRVQQYMILFGGAVLVPYSPLPWALKDTWIWNGTSWQKQS